MIIVPREKPVIEKLNSYYLNVPHLIEHFQGELGTGGVFFTSPSAQSAFFFDEETIINGIYRDKEDEVEGGAALDRLLQNLPGCNFWVSVYAIDPEKVYFWAHLHNAREYRTNLSAPDIGLEDLIEKMTAEKLTGFVEVAIQGKAESGLIFFNNGTNIGTSCSPENDVQNDAGPNCERLIRESSRSGAVFNVFKVFLKSEDAPTAPEKEMQKPTSRGLEMVRDLLYLFERDVRSTKKIKADFDVLLKRKFVEKADQYDFLDPFTSEFHYAAGRVRFSGKTDDDQLVPGVVESVFELAEELGILAQVRNHLAPWYRKYSEEIRNLDLKR